MSGSAFAFEGSIPELYDRLMVPMLFAPYAAETARRVADLQPREVLEVACGTGAVPREVVPLLAETARYVATDLNTDMLDVASARQTDARLTWQQADATALPFEDGAFDLVLSQFGVMFYPDKVAGHREALRVLRPGGTYFMTIWDSVEANGFPGTAIDAAREFFPDNPPHFMKSIPHGYFDVDRIRTDLEAAGWSDVQIEAVEKIHSIPNARFAAEAFCRGSPFRFEILDRDSEALDKVMDRIEALVAERYGTEPATGPFRAFYVTARKAD